jgi:hypothetical protein
VREETRGGLRPHQAEVSPWARKPRAGGKWPVSAPVRPLFRSLHAPFVFRLSPTHMEK